MVVAQDGTLHVPVAGRTIGPEIRTLEDDEEDLVRRLDSQSRLVIQQNMRTSVVTGIVRDGGAVDAVTAEAKQQRLHTHGPCYQTP